MADEGAESQEEEPKKKKPILLIIIMVNVLLGGGAAAAFFLRGGGEHPPPAAAGGDDGHAPKAAAEPTRKAKQQGPLVGFAPLIVNLNEPEGTRFLKIALTVQLANDNLLKAVEEAKPIVRDHFIRELSDLNFRQTAGNKNKLAIKRRLIKRFNEAMGTDAAIEIHITEFIVQ